MGSAGLMPSPLSPPSLLSQVWMHHWSGLETLPTTQAWGHLPVLWALTLLFPSPREHFQTPLPAWISPVHQSLAKRPPSPSDFPNHTFELLLHPSNAYPVLGLAVTVTLLLDSWEGISLNSLTSPRRSGSEPDLEKHSVEGLPHPLSIALDAGQQNAVANGLAGCRVHGKIVTCVGLNWVENMVPQWEK